MEPFLEDFIGEECGEPTEEAKAVAKAMIESLCRAHPSYRDASIERRAYNRQKQMELGDAYCNWFYSHYMGFESLPVGPLRTIDNQGEYHANTRRIPPAETAV